MFSKIRIRSLKRLTKTDSKAENKEEIDENSTNEYELSEVVINHASRISTNAAAPNSDAPNLLPAVAPSLSGVIEPLTLFEEVDISEHPSLFLQKIQLCCILCDFSDDAKFTREKEIKRQTLCELVDVMQYESLKLTEAMQEELIHMVSINIFRCLPPSPFNNMETDIVDPEDEDVYLDPSWPHLQLAYEILLRYIMSSETDIKIAKRYLDHIFILKLLDLFDSEDMREREYLKTILHRIYGNFMVHRPFIRKAISNIFYQFIFETQRHNGIAELLEILGSIIDGFTMPIKQEHRMFLIRTLIPLHKPKSILTYHQQLSYCVVQFVQKDYRLVDPVIKGLLKYWPLTNCQKEVLFLAELEEVLESTQNAEFQRCMVSLFRKTSQCLNSPNFQVAERTLYLWNNEHIVNLIAENRDVILPLIFEALEKNMRGHWNPTVHGLTFNVRKMFLDMDAELFEDCQRKHLEKETRDRELEEQRELNWKKLEAVAAQGVRENMVLVN